MVYFETLAFQEKEGISEVSILVLMDGVLRAALKEVLAALRQGFNPCSNGWCTSRSVSIETAIVQMKFQSLF